MYRRLIAVLLAVLSICFIIPVVSSVYNCPSGAVYAQGGFGRKTGGSSQSNDDAEKRRQEEARKAAEDAKAKAEVQARIDQMAKDMAAADARKKAESDRKDKEARDKAAAADAREREDARRKAVQADIDRKAKQDAAIQNAVKRGTDAAQPTHKRGEDDNSGIQPVNAQPNERIETGTPGQPQPRNKQLDPNDSKISRVGERDGAADNRNYSHTYRPYPYDNDPVIIINRPFPGGKRGDDGNDGSKAEEHAKSTPSVEKIPSATFPVPLTPGGAVEYIRRVWFERNPDLLVSLLEVDGKIKIYKDGEFLKDCDIVDFYTATVDAVAEVKTELFQLNLVKVEDGKAFAEGRHVYRCKDGTLIDRKITYTIELRNDRWYITETGFSAIRDSADDKYLKLCIDGLNNAAPSLLEMSVYLSTAMY